MGPYFRTLLGIIDVKIPKRRQFLAHCLMRNLQYLLSNLFVYLPVFIELIFKLCTNCFLFSMYAKIDSIRKSEPLFVAVPTIIDVKTSNSSEFSLVCFRFRMQYLLLNFSFMFQIFAQQILIYVKIIECITV